MILDKTNPPYLRVGCHSWYQSHYGCNTSRTNLFSKTAVRKRFNAHIRTIVVLTSGKLTWIYFMYLLCYSVTTYRRKGKKVSILSLGDVNPGPVNSR
jgi:hypothetical protein